MVRQKTIKIHAPPVFRDYLYEKKAEHPDKSLIQIMEDIAQSGTKKPFPQRRKDALIKW